METLTFILQIFRFISIAVGLAICFNGYQIRMFILEFPARLKGALLGFLLAFLLVLALSEAVGLSLTIGLIGALVGSIVGRNVARVKHAMGVFAQGAFVGGLFAFVFIISGDMGLKGGLALFLLFVLVGGILAIKIEQAYYTFLFAFLGAGMIVRSLFSYLIAEPVLDFINAFALGEFLDRLGGLIVVLLMVWIGLGILGVLVQYRSPALMRVINAVIDFIRQLLGR